MSKNDEHFYDTYVLELHVNANGTRGGSCLTRHTSHAHVKMSCYHRYQAIERAANEDRSYYNGKVKGWDVSTDDEDPNFRKSSKPYLHEAHHILPSGVLNSTILASANDAKSPELYKLLRAGLLKAKYNINHKSNMIILPMGTLVSRKLQLPVHTRPKAKDMFHAEYSAMIKGKVQSVINAYAKLVVDAREKDGHPSPPDKLSKAKLVRISRTMRSLIFAWGRASPGKSLEYNFDSPPKADP